MTKQITYWWETPSIIAVGTSREIFSPSPSSRYGSIHPSQKYSTTYPSTPLAITYLLALYQNAYSSTLHQDACPQPQSIPQIEYTISIVNQQSHLVEFPQIDSGLTLPVFKQGDDPIDAINKMMSFLSTVVTSRFPSTNNQPRNSSNPRQQAKKLFQHKMMSFLSTVVTSRFCLLSLHWKMKVGLMLCKRNYVKSVFLYGTIDEEVYVSQPPGFVDPKFSNKVYKVVKALYGLHQAP
nr:retrotransposon protein, putative, unclassified [Tanacetum cinerariifolium]